MGSRTIRQRYRRRLAYELVESKDLSFIEATLDKVLEQSGYLEAPDTEEAIAAVEVVAKLLGKGKQSSAYTEEVDAWVASMKQKPDAVLLEKAKRTLQRVVSGESESLDLWSEADKLEDGNIRSSRFDPRSASGAIDSAR